MNKVFTAKGAPVIVSCDGVFIDGKQMSHIVTYVSGEGEWIAIISDRDRRNDLTTEITLDVKEEV